MAHVHSYSQRDADGIFLYDKNKRRIGGPYATEEEATRASKAVSEAMGERPVEDYIEYLQQQPERKRGIDEKFWQSPIPEIYRGPYAPPISPGLLDSQKKAPQKDKQGLLDFFIPRAEAVARQQLLNMLPPWVTATRTGLNTRQRLPKGLLDRAGLPNPSHRRTPPLSRLVLSMIGDRLGTKWNSSGPENLDKLHGLAWKVEGAESSHGKNTLGPDTAKDGKAKGNFQFLDKSFATAKQRLRNIMNRSLYNRGLTKIKRRYTGIIPDRIENATDPRELSFDDQKALFFAHLSEDKGSDERVFKYLYGKTLKERKMAAAELYLWNHYKPRQDDYGRYLISNDVLDNTKSWFGARPKI